MQTLSNCGDKKVKIEQSGFKITIQSVTGNVKTIWFRYFLIWEPLMHCDFADFLWMEHLAGTVKLIWGHRTKVMGQSCFYFELSASLFLALFSHWIESLDMEDTYFTFYDDQHLQHLKIFYMWKARQWLTVIMALISSSPVCHLLALTRLL